MTHEELDGLLELEKKYTEFGNFNDAEIIANKVIAATEESSLHHSQAIIALADQARRKGNHDDAITFAEKALILCEKFGHQSSKAKAWNTLGTTYKHLGLYHNSLEYYHKALSSSEALGEESRIPTILNNIGTVYECLGSYDMALDYFGKALAGHEKFGMEDGIAMVNINIGVIYFNVSTFEKALEHYGKALSYYEVTGNCYYIAFVNSNLGNVYEKLGNYSLSLEHNIKSLSQFEEVGDKSRMALVLGNIGNIYGNISDCPRALEYYTKALSLFEYIGEKYGVAMVTGNIANIFSHLKMYENAFDYNAQALTIYEEIGNKSGIALVSGNIGNMYNSINSFEKALPYLSKALALHEELDEKSGIIRVLGNTGNAYHGLSDYSSAVEYYEKALSLSNILEDRLMESFQISQLGRIYANLKFEGYNPTKAEEYMIESIRLREQLGSKQYLFQEYLLLAQLYEKAGRWQEAQIHFKKFYELEKEVQSEEAKKQADRLAYERREAEREKQLATERARLEEREKIIDELTELNSSLHEANRQKNEVLGIVAHDLKNPLAAILLSSGTLTRYLSNLNQDEILDQLGRIKSTAERMNQIILNLLDIQKLEAGKLSLELKPLEISSILRTMSKNFQDQADKKNIKIQTEIPDFLTALAENSAFQEIIENLISNAIKFSPFDKNIFVRAEATEQTVRISIQDEGPGLTDDDKSKLFGQFTRLSAKPTGGEHSTGLGLSIVKRMVEMMNGKIWCESEAGNGATFIVELPKAE